jgi:GT2 family glycosyltransferase
MGNLGLAEARNTVIKHSDCDVLIFFDADAAPRPGCIEALSAPFSDPSVVAVGGRGEEADCTTRAARWRSRTTPQSHGDCCISDDWMVMGLCAAFRREALIAIGGFDTCFHQAGEDVDVSLRLRKTGGKLVYLPDAIVDHLPSGDLYAVTRQAYTHSKYASYALTKNDVSAKDYLIDSARCLTHSTVNDLKQGRLSDCGIGAINFAARAAGIAAGTLKGMRDRYRH